MSEDQFYEALAEATGVRAPSQENSVELHLVKDAFNSKRPPLQGSFLHHLFTAFEKADHKNFDIMLPLIREMILKYDLQCTCKELKP